MRLTKYLPCLTLILSFSVVFMATGCGGSPGAANVNTGPTSQNNPNTNSNATSNTNVNGALNSAAVDSEVKEPDSYEALVALQLEATGEKQNTTLPTLNAKVARSGQNRRMEFSLPAGGHVVFLDRNGVNYLILREKRQYAELDRNSTGFEVRRMMMPEQIAAQLRALPGVQRVGEERYNGRDAVRYQYGAVTNTGTQAGQVNTNSYFLVDKLTGMPLRSEAETRSASGANVQGFNGVRMIIEMSDITTDVSADLFELPSDFQKIDSQQVRAQVDLVFNSLAMVVSQIINQAKPAATPSPGAPTR